MDPQSNADSSLPDTVSGGGCSVVLVESACDGTGCFRGVLMSACVVYACVLVVDLHDIVADIAWRKAVDRHTEYAAEEPRPAPKGRVEIIVTCSPDNDLHVHLMYIIEIMIITLNITIILHV